ncbi:MAG: HAMP domain-containing protein [Deltaproteobacteria bacterium]|jgi:signal transduction histidine kinase|nr:MAG: HAMP domain-containing protein [Deltaproteobacteria bacterium]
MKISKRLSLGFSLFVLLIGIVGGAHLLYLHGTDKWLEAHQRLDEIETNFLEARREEKNWLLFGEDRFSPGEKSSSERFRDAIARAREAGKDEGRLISALDDHIAVFERIVATGRPGREQMAKLREKARKVHAIIEEVRTETDRLIISSHRKDFMITIAVFITGIIALIFLGRRLSLSIVTPISHLKDLAGAVAQGNLDYEVKMSSPDEIGDLAASLDDMRKKLKANREELIKSERLATIGQFAAHVGHELRNPLSVIKSSVYYLKMKLRDPEEKVIEHLQRVERQISMSDKIISDLLDFSRMRTPVLMEVLVSDIIEDVLSSIAVPEGIEIVKDMKSALPAIKADKDQLRLVFINMVTNAVEAMPGGGRLHIKTGEKDGFQEIEFRDTGCGISGEDKSNIFTPLFSSKPAGIGLGLTLCKSLVEGHGGAIEVESELDKGATFSVRLPIG